MGRSKKSKIPKFVHLIAFAQRHHPSMPRFVVIPGEKLAKWHLTGTTTVEGTVNGVDLGRRSIKQLNESKWFLDLPADVCKKARIEVGAKAHFTLRIASEELPKELSELIAEDPAAAHCWQELTSRRRRIVREYVLSAKRPETRRKRAARALLGPE